MLTSVTAELIESLRAQLGDKAIRDSDSYFKEPRGRWLGQGRVVAPANTAEVATVVRACHAAGVGVVPYGGGTGLVGGQVLGDGPAPVVLSLERMAAIRAVYPEENVIVADAGAILAHVQAAAAEAGRLFPLSLASEGSARIGGLLATNAGGLNVIRYGNARAQCLGLEVVMADGTVWNGLTRLRKDNTGYDLRDLMIGSEGTLGVITGAALKMVPRPAAVGTALLTVASPKAALGLLALAGDLLGETISAFELMHKQGLEFLSETGIDARIPFDPLPEWSVLIEVGMAAGQDTDAALLGLFEAGMAAGFVMDGTVSQTIGQARSLWDIRERIPEGNKRIGSIASHDISLPLSHIPEFIAKCPAKLAKVGTFRINCFGHLGDGNLHYNVFPPKGESRDAYRAVAPDVSRVIHDMVHEFGGSFSAEHGVGRLKVGDLERYGDPAKLVAMRAIKQALDPKGIMNPGAILRSL